MPEAPLALAEHEGRSAAWTYPAAAIGYGLAILGLLSLFPSDPEVAAALPALAVIGLIGVWRWSWAALHLVRALHYRRNVFPRLRARADATPPPAALYVVVTSYRMSAEMNGASYGALLNEVALLGVPAVIVACITDPADAVLLGRLVARRALPEGTALHVLPQSGLGKRDAMADALSLIVRLRPPAGAQVVLMDGDTVLGRGALGATCAVLAAHPDVGAVTTSNTPLVRGTPLVREWYRLRMAQRDGLMCSVGLSRRLLVLTGRFSVFRAEVATSPGFIAAVARDSIHHWRLGTIRMLTGDDKSTWFATLSRGWRMLYVPDVDVYCMEELPPGGFLKASRALMVRWFGNMGRSSGRAIALGPRRVGLFPWLCLLDQRVSPWTTLMAPATVLYASVAVSPAVLAIYATWLLLTRGIMSLVAWRASGCFHPLFPLLIAYNQLVGAAIKIWIFHHPDRQRWTRQKTGGSAVASRGLSNGYLAMSLGAFLVLLALVHGALRQHEGHVGAPTGLAALSPRDRSAELARAGCDVTRSACTATAAWSGATPPAAAPPPVALHLAGPRTEAAGRARAAP